jgi:hypothetical protein
LWVAITLASLAILIILALYIPLDGVGRVDVYGRPMFRMKLVWLFGLVSKEIREGEKKTEERRKAPEGKPKRAKWLKGKDLFKTLRTKGLLRQLITLLKDIFACFSIRKLEANFTVGFDDPADTGFLFDFIGPALLFLRPHPPHQIQVRPSFDAVCEGFLSGTVRLQPIQLVLPLLRFTFSIPTIRAIKTLVSTKWKRRK